MIKLMVLMVSVGLVACASAAKVDMSKAETKCAQACTHDHATCVSKFSIFIAVHKSQCVDALKACVAACPAKDSTSVEPK